MDPLVLASRLLHPVARRKRTFAHGAACFIHALSSYGVAAENRRPSVEMPRVAPALSGA
jgi:hypothetical protein